MEWISKMDEAKPINFRTLTRVGLGLFVLLVLLAPITLAADEVPFNYGDSCILLNSMDTEQLTFLMSTENKEYWVDFCHADDQIECGQFSHLLHGVGYLISTEENPETCQFKRYLVPNVSPTNFPNYGSYPPLFDYLGKFYPHDRSGY